MFLLKLQGLGIDYRGRERSTRNKLLLVWFICG